MSSFSKSADAKPSEDTAVTATVSPSIDRSVEHGATQQRRVRKPRKTVDIPTGTVIDGYQVENLLGSGGCGQVYAAHHEASGQPAAIKVLRSEMVNVPTVVPRFIREVEALSRMEHENIVRVFHVGKLANGLPYYVMEQLNGMDLRQLLKAHGRLNVREVLSILEPVGEALHCAHEEGIIHRDIKASNVFVSETPEGRVIKLLDFGIAKLLYGENAADGLTAPGTMIGTPHAMAPEQIRCEALDGRADIYSLGVLSFLLLTGNYPFRHKDTRALTLMHLQMPPPRPSEVAAVPTAVDEVVLKCMAKSPDDRYASVPEFIAAFRDAANERPAPIIAGEAVAAVGIRLDVGSSDDRELDDEMIEDISEILDIVEGELQEYEFDFPLRASNGLTAVRLTDGQDGEPFTLADAQEVLEVIRELLEERESAHPEVVVSLGVKEAAVECRGSGDAIEFVGGPLLEPTTWAGG